MAETVNIKIQADSSGAEDALSQVKKSLDAGKEAADALNDALEDSFSGALKALGELVSVAEKISELIEQHNETTEAIEGQGAAWDAVNQTMEKSADSTKIKLLEIKEQIDSINQSSLVVFKDRLALIDAQTLNQLKQQFKSLSDEATKAFASMEEGWFKQILFGTRGAQEGIKEVGDRFKLTMGDINDAIKNGDKGAISGIIDRQIEKTNDLIKANQELAGTDQTKSIIAANQRLLAVLNDLKDTYTEVTQTANAEKNEATETDNARIAKQRAASDAFVARVVSNRSKLAAAIKKLAEDQAKDELNAQLILNKNLNALYAKNEKDEKEAAKEKLDADVEVLKGKIQDAQDEEKITEASLAKQLAQNKITKQQEIEAIEQAKQKEFKAEENYIRQLQALYPVGSKKWQEYQNQLTKIQHQEITQRLKAETEETTATAQQWQKAITGMQGVFSSFTQGIINGHQTISQSWDKMVDGITSKFIESLQRQLVEMIMQAATKDSVDEAYYAKSSLRAAYDTAHKAFDWATQYVGPVLAMPVAMAAFAAAESLGSAEGGQYYVPNNQLTMLHPQEMVLPPGIANQMRSVIGGGGSGGAATVIVNHSVQAVDAASFQQHIRTHSNMIANEVARALKRKRA